MASNLLKRCDHFWSNFSSLPSVDGLEALAGEQCLVAALPSSFGVSVFLSFALLLLDSSEPLLFLAFAPGVLLTSCGFKPCLSFATPRTVTDAGSTGCYSTLLGCLLGYVFLSFSDKMELLNVPSDPG